MLVGRRVGPDDPCAVDTVRAQCGERRFSRGVAPDATRDRGADALTREIDRDVRRAPSRLGGNIVDREQFSRLRQRRDRAAQQVGDEDAGAADLSHHALPAQPSAGRRSSTASRTAATSGDHDVLRTAHAEKGVGIRFVDSPARAEPPRGNAA